MGEYFARDYHGEPFQLFGPAHLVALSIVLLIVLLVIYFRKGFSPRLRLITRYTLATILVLNELAWHAWNYFTGQWTIQTMLPLHLCSVLVWLGAYMLVTKSYTIYEFSYFLGIAGALQALLTPDVGIYGFPHFRFFQTMISHGTIILSAIYMTFVEGYRPTWKSVIRVMVWMNVYMVAIGIVNWLIGSNYLFIAHKPETASLIDVLGPWPWYILSLEAIGLVLCLLLYLPYAIRDQRAARLQEN
jgi:hypothetical integral membrane protein (TIGR02206 family)